MPFALCFALTLLRIRIRFAFPTHTRDFCVLVHHSNITLTAFLNGEIASIC